MDDRARRHTYIRHGFGIQRIPDGVGCLLDVLIVIAACLKLLHQDDALFVDFRDEVPFLIGEHVPQNLHRLGILLVPRLDDKDNPAALADNVKLLRAVVDIDQKQVVQKKILDKV